MEDKSLKGKAIDIHGKEYVQVKDRVEYFNKTYENGAIHTDLVSSEGIFIVKAMVIPDMDNRDRFYTGYSQASFNDKGDANKTAPLEVAETSAVGRALAFMGIGVIESIASADEVHKARIYQNDRTFNHKPTTAPHSGTQTGGVDLASDAQIYAIKKLGGTVTVGLTKIGASKIISELKQ